MGWAESQWILGHFYGPCSECPASLSRGLKLGLKGLTPDPQHQTPWSGARRSAFFAPFPGDSDVTVWEPCFKNCTNRKPWPTQGISQSGSFQPNDST